MKNGKSSIRRKTTFIVIIMTLALTIVITIASILILLSNYSAIENKKTMDDVGSAVSVLDGETEQLENSVADWAHWNDTYRFVQGDNPQFVADNLVDSAFTDLNINLVLIVAQDGEIVYQKEYDLVRSVETPASPAFKDHLRDHKLLLTHPTLEHLFSGVLLLDGKIWLLASSPILTSQFQGPSQGTLIFGRIFDDQEIARIASVSHQSVRIQPYTASGLPDDFRRARGALKGDAAYFVQPLGANQIAGYTTYTDVYGQPALIIRVDGDRSIYNNGKNSILFFTLVLLAVGAVFAVVISLSLDHSVISRLEVVYQAINKIRQDKDLTVRIDMPGNDELSNLAGGINETMQALELSQGALKENQARLAYDASHDVLTGFPNRAFFTQRLNQAIANYEAQPGCQAAILFADLDGFKLINDSYDHQFGDRVLIAFGHRLKRCLRTQDFVARLGGDEFAILLENVHSLADATRVAERLLDEVKKPFELGGRLVFQTVSVGIALTKAGIRGDELLRNADMAMYHAKESGKACFAIFDEDMHNQTISRLNLETELRRAVEREEFTIYYQPIVSMFNGEVTSLEALIRWKHPVHGLLLPDRFLNVAKETGLMGQINVFLFHTAIQQIKAWRESGLPELRVALNVSARALVHEAFFELLQRELAEAHVPPSAIQIEVVESEMAANIDRTMDSLSRLEKLGVAISVDDFGTGYSSLAYLKRLPIHSLKIDRTFIKDVIQDRDGAAIVSAMIVMAHVLGLDVVAEGVETESQFRFLLDQSCENAQGYLLSYPQPPGAITDLLKSGRKLLPESEL